MPVAEGGLSVSPVHRPPADVFMQLPRTEALEHSILQISFFPNFSCTVARQRVDFARELTAGVP
jgi:hypothetical protein